MLGRGGCFEKLGSQFSLQCAVQGQPSLGKGQGTQASCHENVEYLDHLDHLPLHNMTKALKVIKVLKITKAGVVSTLAFHYGKFSSAWRRASVDFSKHKLGNRLMVQRLHGA